MSIWTKAKPTAAGKFAALKMLLANAHSLDGFTPEGLARAYGVERKTAEYELNMACRRRAT